MHPRRNRRPGLDALESRLCPSAPPAALPASAIPVPNTDASSTALYLLDAQREATWHPNVVLLGDSIAYNWAYASGAASYASTLGPFFTADYAVPSSRTQNVLWQVENGALRNPPKVVILSVGINNLGTYESVDDTIAGIVADVEAIRAESPSSKIMLTGLFPVGPPGNFLRTEASLVNAAIATIADGTAIVSTDPGVHTIFPDGTIAPNFEPDLIHPNLGGYEIWGSVILGTLEGMLIPPPTATSAPKHPA